MNFASTANREVTEQTANAHVGNAFILSPVDLAKLNPGSGVNGKEPKTPDQMAWEFGERLKVVRTTIKRLTRNDTMPKKMSSAIIEEGPGLILKGLFDSTSELGMDEDECSLSGSDQLEDEVNTPEFDENENGENRKADENDLEEEMCSPIYKQ